MTQIIQPCELKNRLQMMGIKALDKDLYCTKNFAWQELLVRQREIPSLKILNNLKSVATVLQVYRDKIFKGSPIIITSGWRSESYNRELAKRGYKPAKRSLHLYGKALDFVVRGYNAQLVYDLLNPVHFGGMERDAKLDGFDWTHIDIRGYIKRISNYDWSILPSNYSWDTHNKLFHPE